MLALHLLQVSYRYKNATALVNRQKSETDAAEWTPDKTSVVCSVHFEDGKPTDANPLPTLKLGYKFGVTNRLKKSRIRSTAAATHTILMNTRDMTTQPRCAVSPFIARLSRKKSASLTIIVL